MAIIQSLGMRPSAMRLCFAAIAGALLLVGCGGGGGGGDDTPPPVTTLTVTGTVVNQATQAPIPNATVTYAGLTRTTNASGVFSITVNTPVSAQKLRLTATGYYARGFYTPTAGAARQSINFATDGISIPAFTVGVAQPRNVGKFELFVSTGPPPPPPL